jgi:hypothetical protein
MDRRFLTVAEPHCVVALPGKENRTKLQLTEKAITLYGIRHKK